MDDGEGEGDLAEEEGEDDLDGEGDGALEGDGDFEEDFEARREEGGSRADGLATLGPRTNNGRMLGVAVAEDEGKDGGDLTEDPGGDGEGDGADLNEKRNENFEGLEARGEDGGFEKKFFVSINEDEGRGFAEAK